MHIIFYTQYYPPEVGAPQTRLHELAVELVRSGIQVSVLTAMPNYPQGQVYAGYKGWLCEESLDGVRVVRTAIYPTQSARMLPRLFSYFSFMASSLMIGSWKIGPADFLITESPPLFLGIAGWLLSRWKHARWIFNISDLWPESVVELGLLDRHSWGYKIGSALEGALYKKAWLVTGQSQTILDNIRARFPRLHTYHLSNGVDTGLFQPAGVRPQQESFHVIYAGLHGLAQGLEQVLLAAHKIPPSDRIAFTFVGDGPVKGHLIQMAEELGLKTVTFLPPVPKEKIPGILQAADAIIVPLKVQLTGAVPSKLYEAMAMAKPVILLAEAEAARIVTAAECGIVVPPGDLDGLVSAVSYLKNHPAESARMGGNGREAVFHSYDRKSIADHFARFLLDEYARG